MLKQCHTLMLFILMLAGCAHHGTVVPDPMVTKSSMSSKQSRQLSAFNQIDVQGRINVNLHTGYKQSQVILMGDPRDLAQITTVVSDATLRVFVNNGYPKYGAVTADIRGRFLNRFYYVGAGSITGNQLHTSYLDLSLANEGTTRLGGAIGLQKLTVTGNSLVQLNGLSSQALHISLKGAPKVQLTGFVSLAKLDLDGGWLSLYWLKSESLVIRAKNNAKIQLAGVVNKLDVELWGVAQFKGRYLRAQRSFVKTHDKSVAQISVVNHQSSLASDASDIYYYNISNTRADFMAFDGSVLDMREWSQYDKWDFHRYNKQFP